MKSKSSAPSDRPNNTPPDHSNFRKRNAAKREKAEKAKRADKVEGAIGC